MCVSWKYCVRTCALKKVMIKKDIEADGFQNSIFLNYYYDYSLKISVTMWSKTCLLPCFLRFTHIHPQSAVCLLLPTEVQGVFV